MSLSGLGWTVSAQAAAGSLLIVAIQTGGLSAAGQEHIVLANTTSHEVSLDGVRLEYFAATPKSFTAPSRTIKLSGIVPAASDFTLATIDTAVASDANFSATLAAAGGHLRLVGPNGEWDFVGWGTAAKPAGQAAQAPLPGQTLVRRQQNGVFQQTGNNVDDFWVEHDQLSDYQDQASYADLQITELLPDPVPPATDAEGEFIEIYNGGAEAIHLKGLKLVSGTTVTKSFDLPNEPLLAGEYKAYYLPTTKLSLGNNGGRAQLQTSLAIVLSETSYGKPTPGAAWAWNGGDWEWTTNPTPGQANTFQDLVSTNDTVKNSAAKKTTKRTAKSTAKKATKKGEVKSSSTDKPATTTTTTTSRVPVHNGVVAGVGGLAVLYGAYEYRHDARNLIAKLRGNRKSG